MGDQQLCIKGSKAMNMTGPFLSFAETVLQSLNTGGSNHLSLPEDSPLAAFNDILRDQIREHLCKGQTLSCSNNELFKVTGTIGTSPKSQFTRNKSMEDDIENMIQLAVKSENEEKSEARSNIDDNSVSVFESWNNNTTDVSALEPLFSAEDKRLALRSLMDDERIACFCLNENTPLKEKIRALEEIEKQMLGISDHVGVFFLYTPTNDRISKRLVNNANVALLSDVERIIGTKEIKRIERRIMKNSKDRMKIEEKMKRRGSNKKCFRRQIKLYRKRYLIIELKRSKRFNFGTQASEKVTFGTQTASNEQDEKSQAKQARMGGEKQPFTSKKNKEPRMEKVPLRLEREPNFVKNEKSEIDKCMLPVEKQSNGNNNVSNRASSCIMDLSNNVAQKRLRSVHFQTEEMSKPKSRSKSRGLIQSQRSLNIFSRLFACVLPTQKSSQSSSERLTKIESLVLKQSHPRTNSSTQVTDQNEDDELRYGNMAYNRDTSATHTLDSYTCTMKNITDRYKHYNNLFNGFGDVFDETLEMISNDTRT